MPSLVLTTNGDEVIGNTFTLTCAVTVVDRLIVEPNIMWTKEALDSSSLLSDNKPSTISGLSICNDSILSLFFTSLNTSDAARYTCTAVLNITQIDVVTTNDGYTDINLPSKKSASVQVTIISLPYYLVPDPVVEVSLSSDDAIAGSPLTMTCSAYIDDQVDTPIAVYAEWTFSDSNMLISSNTTQNGFNQYISQITFLALSLYDSGEYSCSFDINSSEDYIYIQDAGKVNDSIILNVTSKLEIS